MKKIILVVGMVLMYVMGTSQAISQRGTSAVTVQDARLFAQYNFRPPVFQDTVAANLNLGLDSCGALIFARSINGYYYRACSPKRWVKVSAQGSVGVDSAYVSSATISNNSFILCRTSGTCDTIILIDTLIPRPPSYQTMLVSGSAVWDTLLDYNVTNCSYFILGNFYTSLATTVTLAPADSSNPRIDIIYLDTLGNVGILTGIPSPDPIKPIVDPLSQIELTHININAQGTSPAGISKQIVYNENLQVPTEWNTPTSTSAANYDYLISPYTGFKSANSKTTYNLQFNNTFNVNADTCALLSMYLMQNGIVTTTIELSGIQKPTYYVQLFKAGIGVTNKIGIINGFYGYSISDIGGYQNVVIPFPDFTFANSLDKTFDEILITNAAITRSTVQFDYITIQKGGNLPPIVSNYWSLSGNDNSSFPTAKLGTTSNDQVSIVTNDVERINISNNGMITLKGLGSATDTSVYKPLVADATGFVTKMSSWGNNAVYTVNPIMSMVSNDSNIVYFNADTAAAWRSGGSTPNLQQVTDIGDTTTNDIYLNALHLYDNASGTLYNRIESGDQSIAFYNGTSGNEIGQFEEGTISNFYNGISGQLQFGGITSPRAYTMPDTSGILAMSVNGNFANSAGNITISSTSPNLQQVLDSGNVAADKSIILGNSFDTATIKTILSYPTTASGDNKILTSGIDNNQISLGIDYTLGIKPYVQGITDISGYPFRLTADSLTFGNSLTSGNYLKLSSENQVKLSLPESTSEHFLATSVNGNYADQYGAITISAGGITGSGTANYIPMWNGTSSLTNSTIVDSASSINYYRSGYRRSFLNNLGSQYWYVNDGASEAGWIGYGTPGGNPGIVMENASNLGRTDLRHMLNGGFSIAATTTGGIPTEQFYFHPTGNFTINQSADSNYRFLVNGDSKFTDSVKMSGLLSKTDTTVNKPLAIDASGNVVKMSNWVSGGGSGTVYVDSIYRTIGKDSIYYKKNGNTYAIKDSVGTNPAPVGYYGAFQDTITQNIPTANTAYPIKARITDLSNGVILKDSTRFLFNNTGIYNLQWSGQFQNTDNAIQDVRVWVRKNNVDIIGTTGLVSIPARKNTSDYGHTVAGWNFLLDMVAGDSLQFYWSATSSSISLQYYPLGTIPPSPTTASMVVTITQQSGIMAGTGITAINSLTGAAQTMVTGTDSSDFKIVSTGTTHKFNLPTASATKRGALSSTDWSTFNSKLGASDTVSLSNRINTKLAITDTSVFQRKSISAYSIMANNTNAAANTTAQTYYDAPEQALPTSPTFVGGTAPTGVINNMYQWSQIGKTVYFSAVLYYTTAGVSNTACYFTLPSDCPTPYSWTGITSANQILYNGLYYPGALITTLAASYNGANLMRNGTNNGYWIYGSSGAAGARVFRFTIQYRAQ